MTRKATSDNVLFLAAAEFKLDGAVMDVPLSTNEFLDL